MILAIETSCDDTCAAVVTAEGEIRANVISSQEVHSRFGGVVPEIASRQHLTLLPAVVDRALADAHMTLDDIDAVAATRGPGLVASLLVGFSAAKAIAAARRLPFIPVNHLAGHLAASRLAPDPFDPPYLGMVVSGGHTLLVDVRGPGAELRLLGSTLDDAAGEAFDKGARLLGLGYPGGAALERLARDGDPEAFELPTAARVPGLDFSFAGVKTALLYKVRELGEVETDRRRADLAASFQHAIVEALMIRLRRAVKERRVRRLAVGGGVAANGALRTELAGLDVELDLPPRELCTDNAAMIASAARFSCSLEYPEYLGLDVFATWDRRADDVVPL
jgi:N6-L-threonylcarbamoyladenine synthase